MHTGRALAGTTARVWQAALVLTLLGCTWFSAASASTDQPEPRQHSGLSRTQLGRRQLSANSKPPLAAEHTPVKASTDNNRGGKQPAAAEPPTSSRQQQRAQKQEQQQTSKPAPKPNTEPSTSSKSSTSSATGDSQVSDLQTARDLRHHHKKAAQAAVAATAVEEEVEQLQKDRLREQQAAAARLECEKAPSNCPTAPTCDVWRNDLPNKCRYVHQNKACVSDDHFVHYIYIFYCAAGGRLWWLAAGYYAVWMLMLFYGMSLVAEHFLCPAVEYISELLRLSPDIAGVTLLSFASGAPDIFTQLAAITAGDAVEVELAVSSVVGSGLFICCISLATVILVRPFAVTDRTAFCRDLIAYLLACLVTLHFLWDTSFGEAEAALLLLLYCVYIAIAIYTSRLNTQTVHRHGTPTHAHALPVSTSIELVPQQQPQQAQRRSSMDAAAVAIVASGLSRVSAPSGGTGKAAATGSGSPVRAKLVNGTAKVPFRSHSVPNVLSSSLANGVSHTLSNGVGNGSAHNGYVMAALDEELDDDEEEDKPLLHPSAAARGRAGCACGWAHEAWRIACAVQEEYFPLTDSWVRNAFVLLTAPLIVLLHASMPAVHAGTCSRRYQVVLAMCSPIIFMLCVGAVPEALGLLKFALLWAASSAAVWAVIFAGTLHTRSHGHHPMANPVFAVIAFVQSAVWLSLIADEVVALFTAVGNILAISEDLLGATVLAWGETVPDIMAMAAVARAGQSTMAIAACFGGPVLNLLVGTGVPVLFQTIKQGALPFQLSNGIAVLFLETVLVCALLLALVPTRFGWAMPKSLGYQLLGLYVVFQVVFLLTEEHVVFRTEFNSAALGYPTPPSSRSG